jgi:hypothetical protein
MTGPREPWSDERLAEAFRARAASVGVAPPGLAEDVRRSVAVAARSPRPRFRWNLGLAASVATVLLVAIAVGFGRSHAPTVASSPRASPPGTVGSPTSSAVASTPASSPSVVALETVDVKEALRIRDTFHDGRELVVSGFLSPVPGVVSCPLELSDETNPTLIRCPESGQWLMENPQGGIAEKTVMVKPFESPRGPAFHPSFALVGPLPSHSSPALERGAVSAVLVGHFDDRRSALCDSEAWGGPSECRQTFVVDQIRSLDGRPAVPVSGRAALSGDGRPRATNDVVDQRVAAASGGEQLLSRALVTGSGLATVEPSLRNDPRFLTGPLVWIETTLGGSGGVPQPRTWLVTDGSSTVTRMTDDNQVSLALPSGRTDQTVLCGRYDFDTCAATIVVVRGIDASGVDDASTIAVDDTCPPPTTDGATTRFTSCDRLYPFNAAVVLAPPHALLPDEWRVYHVFGLGESPEGAEPWTGPVPAYLAAMVAGPSAVVPSTPPAQAPGAS